VGAGPARAGSLTHRFAVPLSRKRGRAGVRVGGGQRLRAGLVAAVRPRCATSFPVLGDLEVLPGEAGGYRLTLLVEDGDIEEDQSCGDVKGGAGWPGLLRVFTVGGK
jgi:hypothetical protein